MQWKNISEFTDEHLLRLAGMRWIDFVDLVIFFFWMIR